MAGSAGSGWEVGGGTHCLRLLGCGWQCRVWVGGGRWDSLFETAGVWLAVSGLGGRWDSLFETAGVRLAVPGLGGRWEVGLTV